MKKETKKKGIKKKTRISKKNEKPMIVDAKFLSFKIVS